MKAVKSSPKKSIRVKTKKAAEENKKRFNAFPDKIDIHDWFYRPTLNLLPDVLVSCDDVPFILDQGQEGACTGFALAAVINFHLYRKGAIDTASTVNQVSPRMLYELARKYDEWPGENYEGSSARGTIKGWVAHGVCRRADWKDTAHGTKNFTYDISEKSQAVPGGAYYRVMHRNVREMHAALFETGILFATLMVHDGWDEPSKTNSVTVHYKHNEHQKSLKLPVIERKGRAENGHAIAIVGYTQDGFIIQNSWGKSWGNKGFALLPYEDWLIHASDCWVTQLGVPTQVNLWREGGAADTTAGLFRAAENIPLSDIRPYVVDIGNNGKLSDTGQYWTNVNDIDEMFYSMNKRFDQWKRIRILLYLHGGLNSEKEVARRIIAFRDKMLANEIYPIHVMWETGVWETLKSSVFDAFTNDDDRASAGLFNKLRDGVIELKDRTFELSTSKLGTMMWDEMKENAALASKVNGGMKIFCERAAKIFSEMTDDNKKKVELHIVGHSAGSIFCAQSLDELIGTNIPLKTIQFMAPAITVDLFKNKFEDYLKAGKCPLPVLYNLSDKLEKGDTVGPYGKSLLYLVSNSFEERRETAILGMEKFRNDDLKLYSTRSVKANANYVIANPDTAAKNPPGERSASTSHGGFDNDPYTLNSILYRILEKEPKKENQFNERDLGY